MFHLPHGLHGTLLQQLAIVPSSRVLLYEQWLLVNISYREHSLLDISRGETLQRRFYHMHNTQRIFSDTLKFLVYFLTNRFSIINSNVPILPQLLKDILAYLYHIDHEPIRWKIITSSKYL